MRKSADARILDNAIRDANRRASEALDSGDTAALADANIDLASLRSMRLALNEE